MLFKRKSKEDEEMLSALRKMETLKVSKEGAISVSPHEIVNRREFKESKEKVRKAIEDEKK